MSAGAAWPEFVWCTHARAIPVSRARLDALLEKLAGSVDPGALNIRQMEQRLDRLPCSCPLRLANGLLFRIGETLIPYQPAFSRIHLPLPASSPCIKAGAEINPPAITALELDCSQEDWLLKGNGNTALYVNGKRQLDLAVLEKNSWVFAGDRLLVRLGSILFASGHLEGANPAACLALRPETGQKSGLWKPVPSLDVQSFRIESLDEPLAESDSAMASPAGMIVISSLASALSGFLLNPANPSSHIAGLVSAGISAAGFCGWYGWNGRRQKQRKQQRKTEKTLAWLDYLKKQMEAIDQERQFRLEQFKKERQKILKLDASGHGALSGEEPWRLPALMEIRRWADLELPPLGWQLESTAASKALDQLKSQNLETPAIGYLIQNEILDACSWSKHQVEWFFVLWAWMAARRLRRFAWIGIQPDLPAHPASRLDHQLLYFPDWKAFEACRTLHPAIEWTLCSAVEPPSFSMLKDLTVLALWPGNPGRAARPLFEDEPIPQALFRQSCFLSGPTALAPAAGIPGCLEEKNSQEWKKKRANLTIELAGGVFWNLKTEGPHALVAGATGSGKSEGLCTMLFQLACQNSARFLQYVLIDFKGGSFCMPFADLPHTAALLTNLDSSQIRRLEKALSRELDRRQEALSMFLKDSPGSDTGIENCPDPEDGLPFSEIVVCVDEFGQLKARYSNFMKKLQELARIGRSLGFHLILCTQKPAGLVDEQIWANSKSRLCFPVLDKADSREVLGHDGAAKLSCSGQFILQCGQESEKSGRAFFLKAPASGKGDLLERQPDGKWSRIEQPSLQDVFRSRILSRNEERHWILHPDLNDTDSEYGLMEDKLSHFERYCLPPGENLLAAAGSETKLEQIAMTLAASGSCPVFAAWTFGKNKSDQDWDDSMACWLPAKKGRGLWLVEEASLWQLTDPEWKQPVMVLLRLASSTSFALVKALAECPRISLIVLCTQLDFRQEKLLPLFSNRIFAGMENRDILSQISGGKLSETENWPAAALRRSGMARHEYQRLILHHPDKTIWQAKETLAQAFLPIWLKPDLLTLDKPHLEGLVAIDALNEKPVCHKGKPLTIAWSSAAHKAKAQNLALRLQAENPLLEPGGLPGEQPLCLLDLNQAVNPPEMLRQAAALGNILFAGPGFSSFGYLLQIQPPAQPVGDALWIARGQAADCFMAGLDEMDGEGL